MVVLAFRKPTQKNSLSTHESAPLDRSNLADELNEFDINYSEIHRLLDDLRPIAGDLTDQIVSLGTAELHLRRMIAKYGFDRLPFTVGELHALIEYCALLSETNAPDLTIEKHRKFWRQAVIATSAELHPHMLPALLLYMDGDVEGLKSLHRRENTLTRIGREFQFDDHD